MEKISAGELFAGLWASAPQGLYLDGVVTDSRQARPKTVFVAIAGERVDGHDYAKSAFEKGAEVLVATRPVPGVAAERTVLVPDVLDALIQLGANYRARYSPRVLGVTGSVGKTTTKEFAGAIFSAFGNTVATQGNRNNEIGLPATLFCLGKSTEYAVVEMGMQGLGEIHKLTMAARPEAAIITGIGLSHIERLGTLENTLKAKLEIADSLPQGAPLVLFGGDRYLKNAALPAAVKPVYVGFDDGCCAVSIENLRPEGSGQSFVLSSREFGRWPCRIPALGRHMALDAALAFAAAASMGLHAETAAKALAGYKPAGMRQNLRDFNGICVIEDCYNASPDSVMAALAMLQGMQVQGKRIAVLGDMLELGPSAPREHEKVAEYCLAAGVEHLITAGPLAALAAEKARLAGINATACQSNGEAAAALARLARPGDAVLVKASHGMHFEKLLELFYEEWE